MSVSNTTMSIVEVGNTSLFSNFPANTPLELFFEILSFLDLKSLLRTSQTSKFFYTVIESGNFFSKILKRVFPHIQTVKNSLFSIEFQAKLIFAQDRLDHQFIMKPKLEKTLKEREKEIKKANSTIDGYKENIKRVTQYQGNASSLYPGLQQVLQLHEKLSKEIATLKTSLATIQDQKNVEDMIAHFEAQIPK